jgi:serine/threonine protein phosphatase PrpC|uniref:PPM-type phosphatase domain-containing protein n=1 Tax=viral metagenome TaxID=1070528 RepID=A0A6C0LTS0_9ZZZZ
MIHSKVIQLCKKQDEIYQGNAVNLTTNEPYIYGIIIDGHGNDIGVNDIRIVIQTHLMEILEAEHPHILIQEQLEILKKQHIQQSQPSVFYSVGQSRLLNQLARSGSTFLMTKFYNNRVETFSIGDSEIYVIKNDEIVYHNPIHDWSNTSEQIRLFQRRDINIFPRLSYGSFAINPTTIASKPSYMIDYNKTHSFVPTQALGHEGITEFAPERQTIYYDDEIDKIKIILASDGLWDVFTPEHPDDLHNMKTLNGEELADLAEKRWKQEWLVAKSPQTPEDIYPTPSSYHSNSYDDVSVITITNK